jgi:hypothetical protein
VPRPRWVVREVPIVVDGKEVLRGAPAREIVVRSTAYFHGHVPLLCSRVQTRRPTPAAALPEARARSPVVVDCHEAGAGRHVRLHAHIRLVHLVDVAPGAAPVHVIRRDRVAPPAGRRAPLEGVMEPVEGDRARHVVPAAVVQAVWRLVDARVVPRGAWIRAVHRAERRWLWRAPRGRRRDPGRPLLLLGTCCRCRLSPSGHDSDRPQCAQHGLRGGRAASRARVRRAQQQSVLALTRLTEPAKLQRAGASAGRCQWEFGRRRGADL